MREDDLTMAEHGCVTRCLGKYFRYLNYANTLYTYLLTGDGGEEDDGQTDNQKASTAIAAAQATGAPLDFVVNEGTGQNENEQNL